LWRTQNFIHDARLAARLVASSGIGPHDLAYDLGAGHGILTNALAERVERVVAVEKDPALARYLRARFSGYSNVTIHQADLETYVLPRSNYVVLANPPFDITSSLIQKLTTVPVPPREACLVLQREAAERYLGAPSQTLAALRIAPWFATEVVHEFKRTDFVPAPAVDVVLIRVLKRGPPLIPPRNAGLYRDFIAALFPVWRPSIGPSISAVLGARIARRLLVAAGVDSASKPSMISTGSWLALFERFSQLPEAVRAPIVGAEDRLRRQQRRATKRHRTRVPRDGLPAVAFAPA